MVTCLIGQEARQSCLAEQKLPWQNHNITKLIKTSKRKGIDEPHHEWKMGNGLVSSQLFSTVVVYDF